MPHAELAAIQIGGYVNPWKVGIILVLLIAWAKLLTWMDKDATDARLPREMLNSIMMAALVGGYLLFFLLPGFGLAIGVLGGLFAADIAVYLGMRSRTIGLGDLSKQFNDWWRGCSAWEKRRKSKPSPARCSSWTPTAPPRRRRIRNRPT